jgi:HAAS domain-containing protein
MLRWLRIETAVKRLDWRLEGRVPRGRRREIRRELRANLGAAADEVGTDEALRRLGDVRDLAAEYLEFESGKLQIRAGVYAALGVVVLLELVGLAVLESFRAGFDAAGGTSPWQYSLWPYSIEGTAGPHESWSISISWPGLFGLPLLAFLVWARSWRLLSRRRSRVQE